MDISFMAVLACGITAMVIGYVWYGPLFGKKWMEIIGVTPGDIERRNEMQKRAGPLYAVQFVLVLFQAWVLAYLMEGWTASTNVQYALWVWAGFVIPTIAGASMWNNDSSKVKWARFFIQGGYQLVLFIVFGLILGYWK